MSELCSVPRVSERFAQSNALDEDIARLKYVSGKREEALRRLGIRTVGDLLLHIPHRYLDFTRSWSIEMAPIGTVCTIIATVDRSSDLYRSKEASSAHAGDRGLTR